MKAVLYRLAIAIFAELVLIAGCGNKPTSPLSGKSAGRNLLFVTLDTTRADHIGCYGYASGSTPTIDGLAQRVHDAAKQFRAHRHFQNTPGTLDRIAFGNVLVVAKHYRTDRVSLKVQCKTERITRKLQHLSLHYVCQTVNAADTVGDGYDRALCAYFGCGGEILDLAPDEFAYF